MAASSRFSYATAKQKIQRTKQAMYFPSVSDNLKEIERITSPFQLRHDSEPPPWGQASTSPLMQSQADKGLGWLGSDLGTPTPSCFTSGPMRGAGKILYPLFRYKTDNSQVMRTKKVLYGTISSKSLVLTHQEQCASTGIGYTSSNIIWITWTTQYQKQKSVRQFWRRQMKRHRDLMDTLAYFTSHARR